VDGGRVQRRVGEVAAGAFQALAADPCGDRALVLLEEAVQVAEGDVVGGGDGVRGQLWVVQVLLDECLERVCWRVSGGRES
jgi:hypothetical protein